MKLLFSLDELTAENFATTNEADWAEDLYSLIWTTSPVFNIRSRNSSAITRSLTSRDSAEAWSGLKWTAGCRRARTMFQSCDAEVNGESEAQRSCHLFVECFCTYAAVVALTHLHCTYAAVVRCSSYALAETLVCRQWIRRIHGLRISVQFVVDPLKSLCSLPHNSWCALKSPHIIIGSRSGLHTAANSMHETFASGWTYTLTTVIVTWPNFTLHLTNVGASVFEVATSVYGRSRLTRYITLLFPPGRSAWNTTYLDRRKLAHTLDSERHKIGNPCSATILRKSALLFCKPLQFHWNIA